MGSLVSSSASLSKGYDRNCSYLGAIGSQAVIPEIEKLSKEELKELQTDQLAFKVFSRQLNVSMLSSMDESTEKLKEEILSSIETNDKLTHELVEKKEIFQLKL